MLFPSPSELLKKVQGGSTASPLFSQQPSSSSYPSPSTLLSKAQPEAPSFGSSLFNTAKSFVSKAATAVSSFVGTQAKNVADAATGKLGATPADYLHGTIQTFEGLGNGAVSLAKGFNEGVVRIGKSAATGLLGADTTRAIGDLGGGAVRSFAQDITGTKSTPTYQDIYERAHGYAINNNATPDQATTFGSLAVIGSLFADNPIVGPEKEAGKGLFKLTENAVKDLAATTDETAIKTILKGANPGLNDTQLEVMAPVFREAKTPAEVKAAGERITAIQEAKITDTPASSPEEPKLPAPEEVKAAAEKNLLPEDPTDLAKIAEEPVDIPYFRAVDKEGDNGVKFEPVEGKPVQVADGLETFIHQPENGAFEVLDAKTGRMIGTPGATAEEALQSARVAVEGKTPEEIQAAVEAHPPAPRGGPAAAPAELGAPQPFDRSLIRAISEEDLPGPIADRLRGQFPSLSDQALAPIAKRLSQLHRTGDIEGILQVVRKIDRQIAAARGKAGVREPFMLTAEARGDTLGKAGPKVAVGDLPPSLGQFLTDVERGRYLANVQRTIKDKETAVLAQQEYDALWDHADQRIIDHYEELRLQRDLGRDALSNHPGKELAGLYRGLFKSPKDLQLDQMAAEYPGMDTRIDEITGRTGGDVADAQAELDGYYALREQVLDIEREMREVRPKVQAARILQPMIEDVPVISRQQAGEINALATPEAVRGYKDISGFMGQARDVYRNFEAVFGENFNAVKRVILDPFDKSKGDMVDLLKNIGDDLEENVIKKYGFERGSKESAAIQRYGDTGLQGGERRSRDELIAEFGAKKADDIIAADTYFRRKYTEFIAKVNEVRAQIYPNDPTKLIQVRKDYYRHFTELGDGFRALIDIFETPAGINPQLAGLSEWTKPKSKFLSFAQERLGKGTTIDAIGGFLDYAPSFAYAVHIDQHIGNFRYLRRQLAETAPTPGTRELVPASSAAADHGATELVKQDGINNFLEYLDDFANNLAGKTNPLDRWIQKVVPGGRKTFKVLTWLNSRVKANTILGNISSSIAQIFNVPQGIASAKLYAIPGINRTLGEFVAKISDKGLTTPIDESSFIKERYRDDLTSRFKISWVDHPIRGTSERGKEMAAWITGVLDEIGTKFIWNSHYEMARGELAKTTDGTFKLNGVEYSDPVKFADDITRQMVAGRGVGEVPLIQQSKVFQLVAPFQLEVGNLWYVQGKFLKNRDFAALATLMVANYLMNRAAEEIRGSPVVFDPINAIVQGATQAHDEMTGDGNAGRAALKFLGRTVGEIVSNLPLGQTAAMALSDDWVKNGLGLQGGKKELFGSADPGRFGGGLLVANSIADPFVKLLPPFSGAQFERTIGGISAILQGQVKDSKGQLSYTITPSIQNVIKAVLFGKNATSDAQAYFQERDDLFQITYRQDASRTQLTLDAEEKWAEIKALGDNEAKLEALQNLDKDDPALADAVANVAEAEAQGLNGTERMVKMLGVENGERANYIWSEVQDLKTPEEKAKYLQNLDDKKLIPDEVFTQIEALAKNPDGAPSFKEGKHETSTIIDKVLLYGRAIGVDPATAFERIFTGQKIRRIDNGTIIVERMPTKDSQAEAKRQGDIPGPNGNDMYLDHTVPLELGGGNDKSNLKLITKQQWQTNSPVENYLGELLRSKKATKQQVQSAILEYKQGKKSFEDIQTQFGVKADPGEVLGASIDTSPGTNRPQRNNNPLNIKSSERTSAYAGVVGMDPVPAADGGHFLVFDNDQSGLDAAKNLLTSDIYSGLTVDQALRKWSNKGYGAEIIPSLKNRPIDGLTDAELQDVVSAMAKREGAG